MLPFADNLLRLIEDEDLRVQLFGAGWDFISGKFTIPGWLMIYKTLSPAVEKVKT